MRAVAAVAALLATPEEAFGDPVLVERVLALGRLAERPWKPGPSRSELLAAVGAGRRRAQLPAAAFSASGVNGYGRVRSRRSAPEPASAGAPSTRTPGVSTSCFRRRTRSGRLSCAAASPRSLHMRDPRRQPRATRACSPNDCPRRCRRSRTGCMRRVLAETVVDGPTAPCDAPRPQRRSAGRGRPAADGSP